MYSKIWYALTVLCALPTAWTFSTDLETEAQPELDLSVLVKQQSPPHGIHLRLPSTFNTPNSNANSKGWTPTPGSWFLGTWYFIYSNSQIYQGFINMQWTLSPTGNNAFDNTLNDLTTFELPGQPTVFSIYGVDTPTSLGSSLIRDSYSFQPPGPLAFAANSWEVIGWGYDEAGVPWAALFETAANAPGQTESLDIISRHASGPSKETLEMLHDAIRDLNNADLMSLLKNVKKLTQNGGRNGLPFPTCNATCMTNVDNPFGLKR